MFAISQGVLIKNISLLASHSCLDLLSAPRILYVGVGHLFAIMHTT